MPAHRARVDALALEKFEALLAHLSARLPAALFERLLELIASSEMSPEAVPCDEEEVQP